jgi:hypothetical protein
MTAGPEEEAAAYADQRAQFARDDPTLPRALSILEHQEAVLNDNPFGGGTLAATADYVRELEAG